jgi:hypothetical protein
MQKATIWLWGHERRTAELQVVRYSPLKWAARILLFTMIWIIGSAATLIMTFDPFVASFPFVLGIGLVYHGVRGRFRVLSFAGSCPRCANDLHLKPGSKIPLPHRLDCFHCHFEPELRLE